MTQCVIRIRTVCVIFFIVIRICLVLCGASTWIWHHISFIIVDERNWCMDSSENVTTTNVDRNILNKMNGFVTFKEGPRPSFQLSWRSMRMNNNNNNSFYSFIFHSYFQICSSHRLHRIPYMNYSMLLVSPMSHFPSRHFFEIFTWEINFLQPFSGQL